MLQHYKILTVSHRRTSLKNIGRFVLKADNESSVQENLANLKQAYQLDELVYVATCNRVIYLLSTETSLDQDFVQSFFHTVNPSLRSAELEENVIALSGTEAIDHLLAVSASIDSLVIGERQILGQLREAYEQSRQWGFTGDDMRMLFQSIVQAAKDVYSNTRIGEKPVSVVSLAVQKLQSFHLPKDARILLIGAGQTNILVGKFLLKYQYENITVFNRSIERAELLADKWEQAEAFTLDQLHSYEGGFDCIIVCTGATEPVLTEAVFQQLLHGEDPSEKIIIDLAIPHNTSEGVIDNYQPHYVEIEGLKHLADENMSFREREIKVAQVILHAHLEEFPILYKQRQLEKALRLVPEEIRAVRHRAVNEVFRKEVDLLDDTTKELLDKMLIYMEKKCIGIPMKAAREALT